MIGPEAGYERSNGGGSMVLRRQAGNRRRSVGFLLLTATTTGLVASCSSSSELNDPWFAGYAYLATSPRYELQRSDLGGGGAVFSFLVAGAHDSCTLTWGDAGSLEDASREFDLEQQISGLRHNGDDVALSFGGAAGDELATVCHDLDRLHDAYAEVLSRYRVDTVDFDIELDDLGYDKANVRRAQAVAELQDERNWNDPLQVWLTLPVTPRGLDADASDVVAQTLDEGVDLTGVNLMTMSFGTGKEPGQSVSDAAQSAARAAHGQLKGFYREAGVELTDEQVWNRIGLTTMIGQNDVPGEVLDQADAQELGRFARQLGVGRLSFWALNRDRPCPADRAGDPKASVECSGVDQEVGEFAGLLGAEFVR
jgi:chitinase